MDFNNRSKLITVCYFGFYKPTYSRNKVLIQGLRKNGVRVIECNSRESGIKKYFDLYKKHLALKGNYDVMIVGFPGYQAAILARFIARRPIIFDCFTSIYDSMVWDRKTVGRFSIKALYYWMLDWLSMSLADIVLFDTHEHIEYASKEFHIKKEKFRRIWIGADTDVFHPVEQKEIRQPAEKKFTALFFGTYIPLQGIEYIVRAAKLLENESIEFIIIGDGQEKKKIERLAQELNPANVRFINALRQDLLPAEIAKSDACLGIFGNTEKTKRVIPNKVYECMAMRKPTVSADTPAARELFGDNDLIWVKTADAKSLADALAQAKENPEKLSQIANSGYRKFINTATPSVLGLKLRNVIEEFSK